MIWILLSGIGLAAGVMSGLFGIGGGLIIVPALLWVVGLPIHAATATSLVALLLPVGAFAVYEYHHSGQLSQQHILYGLLIGTGIFIGAYLGAKMSLSLNPETLRKTFAVFLVFAAVMTWFKK